MKSVSRIALVAVILVSVGALRVAHAQSYATYPEPLYPYVVQQPHYHYAYPRQARPRVLHTSPHARASQESVAPAARRRGSKVDPALIEELRARGARAQRGLINDKPIIVREAPRVVEKRRVVDDPPRVIQRHYEVDDNNNVVSTDPPEQPFVQEHRGAAPHQGARTIRAEAEVTILGPDRMSIRLFRRRGGDANAKAN